MGATAALPETCCGSALDAPPDETHAVELVGSFDSNIRIREANADVSAQDDTILSA